MLCVVQHSIVIQVGTLVTMSKPFQTITSTATAVSVHVPRLADFTRSDKSSLISKKVVRMSVRTLELLTIALTGLLIASAYVDETYVISDPGYLFAVFATGLLTIGVFEVLGLYKTSTFTSILTQMPRVMFGWAFTFALVIATLFFLKAGEMYSRVWLATWFSVGGIILLSGRFLLAGLTRKWLRSGRMYRRAAVFGSGEIAYQVLRELEDDPNSDIRITGVFDERRDERVSELTVGYPMLGNLQDLIAFARKTRIDLIIVALPVSAERRIDRVMKSLSQLNAEIKLPGCAMTFRLPTQTYSRIGSVAMIDLLNRPISEWGLAAKWVFDKSVALLALLALAPVMATIAILIKLDSKGPVLFRQKRYGLNNELIEIFKFRSMFTDQSDANAEKLVTKDDTRVTPVGRFLRKTSLDELPQLFNVLRGELSLVGPRPHAVKAKAADQLYDQVVEDYYARHRVKPGITGWAQINGWRGETDTKDKIQKRVEHDLYYIENWSILLDLYVLVMTPFALFHTDNAY